MKKKLGALLTLSLLWSSKPYCFGQQTHDTTTPKQRITIHLYNYAKVSAKTLTKAKERTNQLFLYAGLETVWVDHPVLIDNPGTGSSSTDSWGRADFVLRLLSQARKGLRKKAMGEALSLRIANVFLNRVEQQTSIGEITTDEVLGHAMAHEIGHLLLGEDSHSKSGIMVAKWLGQDLHRMSKGDLRFTEEEVKKIQAEVQRRTNWAHPLQVARLR
jgi:hypothetical protein